MKKKIRVVAAIIEKDEEILIARRLYGNQAGKWEFPGGKYEEGETGEMAIKREIEEEFETEIEVRGLFGTIKHRYPEFDMTMDCFICRIKDGEMTLHDHAAVKWINPGKRGIEWAAADRKVIRMYKKVIKKQGKQPESNTSHKYR